MPKYKYDGHDMLYRCQKVPADNIVKYTGNGDIKVHFWLVISLIINKQLQLLVCDTRARAGIPFGKV